MVSSNVDVAVGFTPSLLTSISGLKREVFYEYKLVIILKNIELKIMLENKIKLIAIYVGN